VQSRVQWGASVSMQLDCAETCQIRTACGTAWRGARDQEAYGGCAKSPLLVGGLTLAVLFRHEDAGALHRHAVPLGAAGP
jgi:hypothetical protein